MKLVDKLFKMSEIRKNLFFNNSLLRIDEKLQLLLRVGRYANARMKKLILARREIIDCECFINIANKKFFVPENSTDELLNGMAQVIGEMYIFPNNVPQEIRLKKGDVYLDLGANIGTTVMEASHQVGKHGKVIAVEPVTSEILKKNLQTNRIDGVVVIAEAVSHKSGVVRMNISPSCIASRLDNGKTEEYTSQITAKTIDDIVSIHRLARLDLIKMDIEGAEEYAILGACNTIKDLRPKWTISSYHVDFDGEPQHDKLVKLLNRLGYKVVDIPGEHIYAF